MRTTMILLLSLAAGAMSGCAKPNTPSLTGANMFHDISTIKKGMSNNEVMRIMGSRYKTIFEEGIRGIDGGNYIWEYSEGRVYFNVDGVTKVVPFEK